MPNFDLLDDYEGPNFNLGLTPEFGSLVAEKHGDKVLFGGKEMEIPLVNPDHDTEDETD